jgi:hypothetical protein
MAFFPGVREKLPYLVMRLISFFPGVREKLPYLVMRLVAFFSRSLGKTSLFGYEVGSGFFPESGKNFLIWL